MVFCMYLSIFETKFEDLEIDMVISILNVNLNIDYYGDFSPSYD
jgi:hypothetical protein